MPYCGSDERFLNITKKEMKSLALRHGINTPKYWFIHTKQDIMLAAEHLGIYPMFIKHYNGCGSKGISIKSKINKFEELFEQATEMIQLFGGALVEEYIDGREFTVLAIENHKDKDFPFVLDPVECVFHGKVNFKHFDSKYTLKAENTTSMQPVTDHTLRQQLIEMAQDSFVCMFGKSHARADFRMNKQGELFFLEINPQPRIFSHISRKFSAEINLNIPAADYIILNNKSFTSQQVVEYLFYLGIVAYEQRQPSFYISFDDRIYGKQGAFANRDFAKGEIVFNLENKPRTLLSRQYANKCLQGRKHKINFRNYAYQISDDMYALFSDNTPMNHSCEPNMWFDEQTDNIYSRWQIKKGEQLTLDYVTFVGDTGLEFDCKCESLTCRKVFNAQDYQKPDVKEKYFGHFSVYLQGKIVKL